MRSTCRTRSRWSSGSCSSRSSRSLRARSSSRVQPRPRRQPRRGGRARDPRAARAGDRGGRDLLDRRPGLAARAATARSASARRVLDSYLKIPSVVAAAETTGCQAVHPGWGFLAENPAFVHACEENDLVFIGPPADVMARMGDKTRRRRRCAKPGSRWCREQRSHACRGRARRRGRRVSDPAQGERGRRRQGDGLVRAGMTSRTRTGARRPRLRLHSATGRCTSRSGSPARHVEIQVIADDDGNVLTLGERECSIQRRHQKLIEESPAGARRRHARGDGGGRRSGLPCDRLPQRRHVRVPARAGSELLHRAQLPPAGRASGQRALDRHRPRSRAAVRSPPASASARRSRAARRPCDRGADQRRGLSRGFLPMPGTIERLRLPLGRSTASTPPSRKARSCRPTTTRCWRR